MYDEQLIEVRSEEWRKVYEQIKVATRLSSALSDYCMDQNEYPAVLRGTDRKARRRVLSPDSSFLYGLRPEHHRGRAVFIGHDCAFTGHAAITIADEVMIAHKVNLVTAGHPVAPDIRRRYVTAAPIKVETNVWIGAAATVMPGVTVGADSVVAAGAVVTRDVPPATLVAGVPARVVRAI